jgi:DNA-binding NtrC family response regulator
MKKLLIIDDSADFREIYSIALGDDYEVHTFASRDAAEDSLRSGFVPDLILMDIQMEGASIDSFLQFCDGQSGLRNMKVIAVSSHSKNDSQIKDLRIPFFQKPTSMSELMKIIEDSIF